MNAPDMSLLDNLNAQSDEYRYLLLDPIKPVAPWSPVNVDNLYQTAGREAFSIVPRHDLAWSPEHCPQLLLLAPPQASCDAMLVQDSEMYSRNEVLHEKRYICGWLSSPLPPKEMANWLAELCTRLTTDSVVPVYEPFRLELLSMVAEPALLASLLAPVNAWHIASVTGRLITLRGEQQNNGSRLSWRAEQVLNSIHPIRLLLSEWEKQCAVLSENAVSLATDAWITSGESKLHHFSDRFFLALNNLILGVDMTQHPAIQALLQQVADTPSLYFTQVIENIDDSVWQALHPAGPLTERSSGDEYQRTDCP
ncbi:hypothetical protein [Mangrovibacter yixingensis]|uniref:hypothetical protein n=1 Tax=Mangrovibacter yixingensis TaxID=1529639 RepID=UPI001CFA3C31|nr:hypothetical protein [Mangrovibacter yixingensis]